MFKKDAEVYNSITHIKGIIVIIASFLIAILLLTGTGNGDLKTKIPLFCACVITFYFGSKS